MPKKLYLAALLSIYAASTILPSLATAADDGATTADQSKKKKKKGSHDGE